MTAELSFTMPIAISMAEMIITMGLLLFLKSDKCEREGGGSRPSFVSISQ